MADIHDIAEARKIAEGVLSLPSAHGHALAADRTHCALASALLHALDREKALRTREEYFAPLAAAMRVERDAARAEVAFLKAAIKRTGQAGIEALSLQAALSHPGPQEEE